MANVKTLDRFRPHPRVHPESGPGRTKQSFADESNINIIMKRYEKTGVLDHFNQHQGDYGDFIAAPDYHTAMNMIRDAGEMFMEIPATVRAQFKNDPAAFLAFVQDPDNTDAMIEMGLARPAPVPDQEITPKEAPSEPPPPSEAD